MTVNISNPEQNSENFVGAESDQVQPTNPSTSDNTVRPNIDRDDLLEYEKERKCLFRIAFSFAIAIIFALYVALVWWIYCQSDNYHIGNNLWHIAVILAIPPTTLLFLILRLLSRQPQIEQAKSFPASEFMGQIIDIIRDFFNSKK